MNINKNFNSFGKDLGRILIKKPISHTFKKYPLFPKKFTQSDRKINN